jgi:signal transduction histidine kinase
MDLLLNDLLTYSRLSRHYYNKSKEPVDTGLLVKEMIHLLAPPPDFAIEVRENMPTLMTYRLLLELVFKNLIGNALKHHHRGQGQIQVSAREVDDFIEFSVTDDGPGIDPVFHDRIFQVFQVLQPRDQVEGSGMGLPIVQRAIESQGGTIQIISTEGKGATFRFTWPKR